MSPISPKKSHVMRLLESRRIPYQVYTYSPAIRSAEDVAPALGFPPHAVYKTLVVLPPRGKPLLVLIPGPYVLDLKRLAQAVGEKKLRMATHREAEALTGLPVGGISAETLSAFVVSAGQRGMNLCLRVADFVYLTKAHFVDAAVDRESVKDLMHPMHHDEGEHG